MRRAAFLLLFALLLTLPCLAAPGESWSLGEGVELERVLDEDGQGVTRELWFLTVDMERATLLLATPGGDADNDGGQGRGASLLDMAADARAAGRDVVAAVNGDFYKTGSDGGAQYAPYALLGVMVKDGVLVSEGQRALGAAYFGVTREGRAVMGSAAPEGDWDANKDGLYTAIGGELLLIHRGESNLSNISWRTDSATLSARYGLAGTALDENGQPWTTPGALSVYPRSCIGIREDGAVVVMAASVGGSTPGLTIVEATQLMLARGCVEMMNLDGGPSTQMAADRGEGLRQLVSAGVSPRLGGALLAVTGPVDMTAIPEEAPTARPPLLLLLLALILPLGAFAALVLRRRRRR